MTHAVAPRRLARGHGCGLGEHGAREGRTGQSRGIEIRERHGNAREFVDDRLGEPDQRRGARIGTLARRDRLQATRDDAQAQRARQAAGALQRLDGMQQVERQRFGLIGHAAPVERRRRDPHEIGRALHAGRDRVGIAAADEAFRAERLADAEIVAGMNHQRDRIRRDIPADASSRHAGARIASGTAAGTEAATGACDGRLLGRAASPPMVNSTPPAASQIARSKDATSPSPGRRVATTKRASARSSCCWERGSPEPLILVGCNIP